MSAVTATSRERRAAAESTDGSSDHESQTALRLLLQSPDEHDRKITLPTLATAGDVREAIQYLKKKPGGVSIVEALDDVKKRVFEANIERVRTMLDLVGFNSRQVTHDQLMTGSVPLNHSVLLTLQGCSSAVVVVGEEDCHTLGANGCELHPNVLFGLGVAFALYERRVLVLLDARITLPLSLRGLPHLTFDVADLTWEAGVTLMTAIKALDHGTFFANSIGSKSP